MAKDSSYSYVVDREGVSFSVTAQRISKNWYECTVEVAAPKGALAKIDTIEYVMHESFPKRFRRRDDAERNFQLEFECYEGFKIGANVHFKDGQEKNILFPVKVRHDEDV